MTYISIRNHAKLTGLSEQNVTEMMLTGVNFLDASILTYVSKIDGIPEEIMFDDSALEDLKAIIEPKDFKITIVGSVIKIENTIMPPSLFFLTTSWKEALAEQATYNENFTILIPHRNSGPMFIGEETVIERLSDDFDGKYDIISIKDVEKG